MGCINSQNIQNSTKEVKRYLTLTQRIILNIQQGNMRRLRELIQNTNQDELDYSLIQGYTGDLTLDSMEFSTNSWGPVLLALYFNQLQVAKYFMEEIKLNPAIYLIKPMTEEEYQYTLAIKRATDRQDKKEYSRFKNKLNRYNRIISWVIACKHENKIMLEYLLEHDYTKNIWMRKDFYTFLHFISNSLKIWLFALPIIMQSQLAKRWFYSEKEINKSDVFYRLQRQFSIKILLDEMFFTLQEQLSKPPYSTAFFISLSNQEYIDDKVPEINQLRQCLQNIIEFDFTMIHEEINYFPELKDLIVKRFDHVHSYKMLLNEYCEKIDTYNTNLYQINQELDQISTAIMREDIQYLSQAFARLRIENVNQVQLRVQINDRSFNNSNILTFALINNKPQVLDYLLENDLIDIQSCSKNSPTTLNSLSLMKDNCTAAITHGSKSPSTKEWANALEQSRMKQTNGSYLTDAQTTMFNESLKFPSQLDFKSLTNTQEIKFNESIQSSPMKFNPKKNNITKPLEYLIKLKNKDLFLKYWSKFMYQLEYPDFNKLLLKINTEIKSDDWYRSFLNHNQTKIFFEQLKLAEQLDFIEKIINACDFYSAQTNDINAQDLVLESFRENQQLNKSINHFLHQNMRSQNTSINALQPKIADVIDNNQNTLTLL
ncbi:UNKNOWN [Stylonychia lemnae]|uniref:Ankyrin repeat-containing protein n=1 Tax=Stylonychia lemnae TaxID=5949 RepID=A0A078AUQ3_STYLE|nr:UNKNOWN [Stylonychia lemnae]|eukprot:CDW84972.1 UNKNOWN [Stylonychia lemnae]